MPYLLNMTDVVPSLLTLSLHSIDHRSLIIRRYKIRIEGDGVIVIRQGMLVVLLLIIRPPSPTLRFSCGTCTI
jgi:hypothetical protein